MGYGRQLTILALAVLWVGMAAVPSIHAQQIKFAHMDFVRVFNEVEQFQQMKNQLESLRRQKEQELEQQRRALMEEFNEFDVNRELMTEEAVQKRQEELMQKQRDLMQRMQQEQIQLTERKNDRLDPLIDKLRQVVETIAQEEGYTFIFKKVNLAYGAPEFDITDKVIARMNKQ